MSCEDGLNFTFMHTKLADRLDQRYMTIILDEQRMRTLFRGEAMLRPAIYNCTVPFPARGGIRFAKAKIWVADSLLRSASKWSMGHRETCRG